MEELSNFQIALLLDLVQSHTEDGYWNDVAKAGEVEKLQFKLYDECVKREIDLNRDPCGYSEDYIGH